MCLGAIYWARLRTVFYANTRADASAIHFDDDLIYREIGLPLRRRKILMKPFLRDEALKVFEEWTNKRDKVPSVDGN